MAPVYRGESGECRNRLKPTRTKILSHIIQAERGNDTPRLRCGEIWGLVSSILFHSVYNRLNSDTRHCTSGDSPKTPTLLDLREYVPATSNLRLTVRQAAMPVELRDEGEEMGYKRGPTSRENNHQLLRTSLNQNLNNGDSIV